MLEVGEDLERVGASDDELFVDRLQVGVCSLECCCVGGHVDCGLQTANRVDGFSRGGRAPELGIGGRERSVHRLEVGLGLWAGTDQALELACHCAEPDACFFEAIASSPSRSSSSSRY